MTPTFNLQPGTYFGGKGAAGVVHRIINQIPRHDVFISGFLGRCAVMRWKRPASLNIGFDLDSAVIAEWRDVAGVVTYQRDFLHHLNGVGTDWANDIFLYLDPPYLPETRSSAHKYNFELTYDQHVQLLREVKKLPCMVAISCYDSDLYSAELVDWRRIHFRAQTRGGIRTETLYMNYPTPTPDELHDRRFLGENFRAREKGKRRIETIKSKIQRLDPTEKARLSDWLQTLVNNGAPT